MPSRHYNAKKRRTFATEYKHLTSETKRAFKYFVAFLGGAAGGAACGLLFAADLLLYNKTFMQRLCRFVCVCALFAV